MSSMQQRSLTSTRLMDDALALLQDLNSLRAADGRKYSSMVDCHGFRPWWFHQQAALDDFILPFLTGLMPDMRARRRGAASRMFYGLTRATARLHPRTEFLVAAVDGRTPDGSNRWISGLHDALCAQGHAFTQLLWSASGARALHGWRSERRAIYVAMKPAPRSIGRSNTDRGAFIEQLAQRVLLPRAAESARVIQRYRSLLRTLRPRGVFFMDDPVHPFELVVACRLARIPTVAVQHGQFSRFTAGIVAPGFEAAQSHAFDRYCVWSEYFAHMLRTYGRLVPASSIVVTGPPRAIPQELPAAAPHAHVLVIHEREDPAHSYVAALRSAGVEVRVRQRAAPVSVVDDMRAAAVIVASHSTAIFEAIAALRPVVLIGTPTHHDPHALAASGLAAIAATPGEVAARIIEAQQTSRMELERRRQVVWEGAAQDGAREAIRVMSSMLTE